MTTASQGTTSRRWVLPFLAALVAVLAVVFAAATASAATTTGSETRVGASSVVVDVLVGPPQSVSAGERLGKAAPRVVTVVATGVAANDATRLGETVSPLGRTYENSDTYLGDVANHYGINLRGVRAVWDHSLGPVTKGLTRQTEGGWIIRINPGFVDEADLANTIAHELSHARDFHKGLSSFEGPATASGNALEEWIYGLR